MSTASNSTSKASFLTLPAELRNKIYSSLLCPDPESPRTLYHDRHGRKKPLGVYPSVLRTNKQVHAEALPFLYERNTFVIDYSSAVVQQCTGGSYPDQITNPPPLLRDEKTKWRPFSRRFAEEDAGLDEEKYNSSFEHGIIYPHVLRRMSHLHLCTAPSAVWGSTMGGEIPSHIGPLLLELLRVIAEECPSVTEQEPKKKLKVVVSIGWRGGSLFGDEGDDKPWIPRLRRRRNGGAGEGLDINSRLGRAIFNVSKMRDVQVEEDGKPIDLKKLDR